MRTLLFDIDGTLLMTNGGGRHAFGQALRAEFGIQRPKVDVAFAGRTDRSLIAELLEINGLPINEQTRERLKRHYTSIFPAVLAERGGYVLPGVPSLLRRLVEHSSIRIGVMTGNLSETAAHKLEHFDLLQYVGWIVGGDLDHDRNDLALRAAKVLSRRHGQQSAVDVVVIGDTPADVKCGHVIGARVVAVCTGNHSRDELKAENPADLLDDFSDVDAACDILTQ